VALVLVHRRQSRPSLRSKARLTLLPLQDVSVSLALFISLRKKMAGFNATTDNVLSRMMTIAVATASYTAILSAVGAVLGVAFDEDNLWTTDVNYAFWVRPIRSSD
jgi:hypothetical protein